MRLGIALTGDLRKIVDAEIKAGQSAVTAGFREAGEGLRRDLRAHTQGAGLGRLGRAWTLRVYRGRSALSAAALVYPSGRAAREALWSFEHGAVVRPTKGRYLAIPTQFNRAGGRRGGKVLFRPDQLTDSFVARSRGGQLLLFARVQHAQGLAGRKRGRDLAFVDGHQVGSGRRRRTAKILDHGMVPMFVLKEEVKLSKRLTVETIAAKWTEHAAQAIVKHWAAHVHVQR